jgi:tetratricopeptide (TPR) repeat protein
MKAHSFAALGKALTGVSLVASLSLAQAQTPAPAQAPAMSGQERAALVFQILASEIALAQGEIGVAAVTYLSVARQTQDPAAARRATELAIEARMPQRAEEAAQIWLASAPNDREAQTTLDLLQAMMGETEKLIRSLQPRRESAANENRLDVFYDYVASLAGRANDRAQGLLLFESVSKPDSNLPGVLYTRAMLLERAGRHSEMESLLRELIAREPQHAHAHNALGYHFADQNIKLPEALALIEKALSLAPNDAHIIDSMGWVHFRLGNLDLAEKYLRKAHAKQPDAEISTHLGEVLWAKGQTVEAEAYLRAAFSSDPRNEVLLETLKRLGIPPLQVHPR